MRRFPVLFLLLLVLIEGCSRGSHPSLVGSPAPDFTVQDADRKVTLHDLRGKVVVLNFWATWCPPCVEEMPSLVNELYGTFKFPETYIIDRQGVVRRKFIGPVDWTRPDVVEYLNKL
jgi:cytochrome c biogenesis protein CcmG/thiol:disulfide interchange protein DsbE